MAHKPILFPWQQRWVADKSRLKIAAKSTQIGFSFGESYSDVVECLERDNELFAILSRSERQALEFARKAKEHCNAVGAIAQLIENDSFQGTSIKQHLVEFPNGSRIIALTSNPDTARGYTGNVVLDEFAFHKDGKAVFAAAYGRATRGFKLRVISTPFGESGKFFELAKACDLNEGRPPLKKNDVWSGHWCDIHLAVKQGFSNVDGTPVDIAALRAGVDDEDIWQQEYCCIFLSEALNWIAWELIASAMSVDPVVVTVKPDDGDAVEIVREALAKISVPAGAEVYMGGDIGRKRDLSSFWPLVKMPGLNLLTTPIVVRLKNQKFKKQREVVSLLMDTLGVRRHCQDSTGIGAQLAEELQDSYGEERIEKVDFTLAVKEDLAVRTKRLFEDRGIQIPDNRDITASIHAVKKFATAAGNFRFDAARTDAGHADDFWSLSLSALAAANPAQIGMANQAMPAGAFQPERQGIMSRVARDVAEVARTGIITGTSRREERRSILR